MSTISARTMYQDPLLFKKKTQNIKTRVYGQESWKVTSSDLLSTAPDSDHVASENLTAEVRASQKLYPKV